MKLRCQIRGTRCPLYVHEGVFKATDEMLTRFESDVNWCAKCTACEPPALPSFQDDLSQIARITLWKKGPAFDPNREGRASFRTYILPWICGALIRAKKKESRQYWRFLPGSGPDNSFQDRSESNGKCHEEILLTRPNTQPDCGDALIYEMWNADFEKALPQLLQRLTKREQQVFICIREDMKQVDIAERLELSKPRVSQLLKQVELKLRCESQNLGLIG